jgi:hypothetical protein
MIRTTIPTTPASAGGNLAVAQRTLGAEVKKLVRTYVKQIEKHHEQVAEIHQTILAIGRALSSAKALTRNTKDFGAWCEANGMAEGRFGSQQERTAAMLIAELHDTGVPPHGLDGDDVPAENWLKLDLSNCLRTAPTNIMAWARKAQPELFPHLAKKRYAEAQKRATQKRASGKGEGEEIVDDTLEGVFAGDSAACEAFVRELIGSDGHDAAVEFMYRLYDEGGRYVLDVLAEAIAFVIAREEAKGSDEELPS